LRNNDLIIVLGTMLSKDDKELLSSLNTSKITLMSVMEDTPIMDKIQSFSGYEAGSEEGVIAILTKELLSDKELPKDIKDYFDNLDEGYISAETNIGEEELEELHVRVTNASSPLMILGKDVFLNPRISNINVFINLLSKYSDIELLSLVDIEKNEELVPQDIEELDSFDGTVVFNYKSDEDKNILSGSKQFSVAAKVQDGENIEITIDKKIENRKFVLDSELKGTIALMPMDEVRSSYRFKVAKITKREMK